MVLHDVLLCYDADGNLDTIVHRVGGEPLDVNDPAWNLPGGATIKIPRTDYDSFAEPHSIGMAAHHELNTFVLPHVYAKNVTVGVRLQQKVAAHAAHINVASA